MSALRENRDVYGAYNEYTRRSSVHLEYSMIMQDDLPQLYISAFTFSVGRGFD